MNDLKNKNIIITGASGGIGNSIVKKLSDSGANILATGTKIEKLEQLKSDFKNIKILRFDISQSEQISDFIEILSQEIVSIPNGEPAVNRQPGFRRGDS